MFKLMPKYKVVAHPTLGFTVWVRHLIFYCELIGYGKTIKEVKIVISNHKNKLNEIERLKDVQ